MSLENAEFFALVTRACHGDPDATVELVEQYGDHVIRAVRRRLHPRLRRQYDSADFGQAVWKSFFENRPDVDRFEKPENLIAYLAKMAEHKVIDEVRSKLETRKNDLRREQDHPVEAIDADVPTPSQFAMANETLERLQAEEPTVYRGIVDMRRAGMTCEEVAEELGVHEKTVRRVFRRLREHIES